MARERTIFPGEFEHRTSERQAALRGMALEGEAGGGRPWSPAVSQRGAAAELEAGRAREGAAGGAYGAAAGLGGVGGAPFTGADALSRLKTGHQAFYSALSSLTQDLSSQLAVAEAETWDQFQGFLDEELERLQYGE